MVCSIVVILLLLLLFFGIADGCSFMLYLSLLHFPRVHKMLASLIYHSLCRGYKRFYRRTSLEASDFLKDDCLVMRCTVGVVRTRVESSSQSAISVPPSDMGRCLKEMLESRMGSDIVFIVGDETFHAHKLVLAARSPVFHAQFFGPIGNRDTDKVVLQDIESSVFKVIDACSHSMFYLGNIEKFLICLPSFSWLINKTSCFT